MTAFGLLLGSFFALFLGAIIVSVVFGKLEGVLTCLVLTVFQGIVAYNLTPLVLESQRNVTYTPQINIGMLAAVLILIFDSNKNVKIGAAAYLVATALTFIPVLLSLT